MRNGKRIISLDELVASLTLAEAAELMRCTPRTVRNWISDGRLQAYKMGGELRILREDLAAMARPVNDEVQEG